MIIDTDIVTRSRYLADRARAGDAPEIIAEFAEWTADAPDEAARVMYVLAMTAGIDADLTHLAFVNEVPIAVQMQAERQAHAAYARGIRTEVVRAGEAAYQRRRKGAARRKQRVARLRLVVSESVNNRAAELALALQHLPAPDERRRLRVAAGLSLAEAADICETTKSSLGKWERGLRTPTGDRLLRYFELLQQVRTGEAEGSSARQEGSAA